MTIDEHIRDQRALDVDIDRADGMVPDCRAIECDPGATDLERTLAVALYAANLAIARKDRHISQLQENAERRWAEVNAMKAIIREYGG